MIIHNKFNKNSFLSGLFLLASSAFGSSNVAFAEIALPFGLANNEVANCSNESALNSVDSIKSSPDKIRIQPKLSMLANMPIPQVGFLGYLAQDEDDSDDDERMKFIGSMVENGDVLKFKYLYLPMQPYGVELLRQFVATGDTFAKQSVIYLYGESGDFSTEFNAKIDSILVQWRRLYQANEVVGKNWVWKSSFPKIRDYERGYSLACKNLLTHSVEPPVRIKYQVDALISNAVYVYYDEMSSSVDELEVDAAFSVVGTFYTFAKGYDTLRAEFKAWLPPAQFEKFNEMVEMYLLGDQFFGKKSKELFSTLNRRESMMQEVALVSKTSPVLLVVPGQEAVVNNKKMGIQSYLKTLLGLGVDPKKMHRWIQVWNPDAEGGTFESYMLDSVDLNNPDKLILRSTVDTSSVWVSRSECYFPDSTEDENWQNVYFLHGFKSANRMEKLKELALKDTGTSSSYIAFAMTDGADSVGVGVSYVFESSFFSNVEVATDSAMVYDEVVDEMIWEDRNNDMPTYYDHQVPKLRHSNLQLGLGVEQTNFTLKDKYQTAFASTLDKYLPGVVVPALQFTDVKFIYQKGSLGAKTWSPFELSYGRLMSTVSGISGYHFGYNNYSRVALDKKQIFSLSIGNNLDVYNVNIAIPESGVSSIGTPLKGKSIQATGANYGILMGLNVRLGSLFMGASCGYGWDLGKGSWYQGKQELYGLPTMKFTGWNYRLEAGFKVGLVYKKFKKEESEDRD